MENSHSNGTAPSQQDNKSRVKLWMPSRVVFTPDALDQPFGKRVLEKVSTYNLPVDVMNGNRITGLRGVTEKETYKIAKSTLAIVNAPPSAFRLRPIPPSADFQFHLAEGCPAHCQYCYLAGSLQGPPAVRAFANLPAILQNTTQYHFDNKATSFEASCYTDPLSIEHLTGSLSETISFFGTQQGAHLRAVTKFDAVDNLLHLQHNGNTRMRFSLNVPQIAKMEGGTATVANRINALRKMAMPKAFGGGGYKVGVVLAPIMPVENWQMEYGALLNNLKAALDFPADITFELITHRFTTGSKEMLLGWYPNTKLEMDENNRAVKTNKFGGTKYVYRQNTMQQMKQFFYGEIKAFFPSGKILYWT